MRIGIIEVCRQHWYFGVSRKITDFVSGERSVLVRCVFLNTLVELMVAKRNRIVIHYIHRSTHNRTLRKVGYRSALVDITSIKEKNIVVFTGSPCLIENFCQIGKPVLEGVLFTSSRIDDVAMYVARFENLNSGTRFLGAIAAGAVGIIGAGKQGKC